MNNEETKGKLITQKEETGLKTTVGNNIMNPEEFKKLLQAAAQRRESLREYIKDNFKSGVHYCKTGKRWEDSKGRYKPVYYMDGETVQDKDKIGKMELLQPGAQTACDTMECRYEWHPDHELVQVLGNEADGHIILVCKIISRNTGEIVGEGRGACSIKEKYGSVNSAIKQSQIRSLRNAVINTFALSDLYEQDVDDAVDQQNKEAEKRNPKRIFVEEKILQMNLNKEAVNHIYDVFDGNSMQMYNVFKFLADIEDEKILSKIKTLTPIQVIETAKNARCDIQHFASALDEAGNE